MLDSGWLLAGSGAPIRWVGRLGPRVSGSALTAYSRHSIFTRHGRTSSSIEETCYPWEMTEGLHVVLTHRPDWDQGVKELRLLWDRNGVSATERANHYGGAYSGRRGSMVFDVVASRQRKYNPRVLTMVAAWETLTPQRYARRVGGRDPRAAQIWAS